MDKEDYINETLINNKNGEIEYLQDELDLLKDGIKYRYLEANGVYNWERYEEIMEHYKKDWE